jgi:limonene-1,2-epoxide hydrolase
MTALETAQTFMASWKVPNGFDASFNKFFTPDCLYENVGLSKTKGPAEALAFFAEFAKQCPFAYIDMDLLSIAASGDAVLTERIDYLKSADGKTLLTIPLMGIMKIRNGQIYEWRDYFDTAPFMR